MLAKAGPLGIVAALLLAGCVTPPPESALETSSLAPLEETIADLGGFRLEATDCVEGGGHSVHPKLKDYLPAPWEQEDILEDVGKHMIYSEAPYDPEFPVPTTGHTMGNYHANVACRSWTLNGETKEMMFGFVSMRVKPPPFDDGKANRHYLTTVIATSDHWLHEFLHKWGFHATTTKGGIEWQGEVFHHILDTTDHGIYESVYMTKDVGAKRDGITRLWFQMENSDGTFSPVAIDMIDSGGGKHLIAEPEGYFSHLRTEDHYQDLGFAKVPIPGAAGHIAGLTWTGFDRTFTLGPRPDVRLKAAYLHA
ncbi:MAG: hypothetical protein HY556_07325 [Euryarchaeota archaeon]|nr:hypothetical protein [Euryarchaeota archaeon]